jgi:hypothetical protein
MYILYKNEYRIFKPVEITIRRRLKDKEKNRDEPILVIPKMEKGNWYQWEGEDTKKGCRRMNMVEILRTHV